MARPRILPVWRAEWSWGEEPRGERKETVRCSVARSVDPAADGDAVVVVVATAS